MEIKLLIADDDPALRRLVEAVVSGCGRTVILAEDGEEALAACQGGGFSLLILDNQMPGHRGIEVARRLRESGDQTPVLLASGTMTEQVLLEAGKLGGVTCLSKPYGLSELRDAVEGILSLLPRREDLRLGTLALQSGMIAEDQLVALLDLQSHEARVGRRRRLLGRLFIAEGLLSEKQLEALLKRQRDLRAGPS